MKKQAKTDLTGLENAPKIMQDFVKSLEDKQTTLILTKEQSAFKRFLKSDSDLIKKTRKPIFVFLNPIFRLINITIFLSIIVALLVEYFYA